MSNKIASCSSFYENEYLSDLINSHIESFDEFIDNINRLKDSINKAEFEYNGDHIRIFVEKVDLKYPSKDDGSYLYPNECRVSCKTYEGKLTCHFGWSINNIYQEEIIKDLGNLPIMVKSKRCAIKKFDIKELIKCGEEFNEMGGYFICNGIERIIRFLVVPRRNYAICMTRPSWKGKISGLSEYGIYLRSVNKLNNVVINIIHYNTNSTLTMSILYRGRQYFIPLIIVLRLLVSYTDFHIYSDIIRSQKNSTFWKESVKCMISYVHSIKILNMFDAKNYLANSFRTKLSLPVWYTNDEICDFFIKNCLCIHIDELKAKYEFIVHMCHKMMSFIEKEIDLESPDALNYQEVLTPGQLIEISLIDKISIWLNSVKIRTLILLKSNKSTLCTETIKQAMNLCGEVVGKKIEYFIKSGNFIAKYGINLPQKSGFTIVADRLNFVRYLSHFRSIHRGSYFNQSYSSKVRKLLPECWGFICPVHTPDGAPCGLLNHFTKLCQIVNKPSPYIQQYYDIIYQFGIVTFDYDVNLLHYTCIQFDGKILGYINVSLAPKLIQELIKHKISIKDNIEIIYINKDKNYYIFPGIYIFSNSSRVIRPIYNLNYQCLEYIGPFEQIFMNISIDIEHIKDYNFTHCELNQSIILSIVASLIPFSEYNQSPRNMYQCQMIKQSMGVPLVNLFSRFENKLYLLNSVQSPICKNDIYSKINMDSNPLGLNAVIAVISYTGYDMEDAIIINKSAIERGFGSACIYKSTLIDLQEISHHEHKHFIFDLDINHQLFQNGFIDQDGLPFIGRYITRGEPFYSYIDLITQQYHVKYFNSCDYGYIDGVVVIDSDSHGITKIQIRIRIPRNPIVGDKFSSRHGQKGVLSIILPAENMPVSESGIIPDIIFNPHGFPSRMTVGMMIELICGKIGAINGQFYDSSPFIYQNDNIIQSFGDTLKSLGYNFYGTEQMYSGENGKPIEALIFTGIVYYQRLRHMVSDKYQVRTTGPVDPLTLQPVGGRKKGGGVRFGEMERDALISHGCSFLVQDRLFNNSDKSLAFICQKCGDILATKLDPQRAFNTFNQTYNKKSARNYICLFCNSSSSIVPIYIPSVLRYLAVELSSMNIQLQFCF